MTSTRPTGQREALQRRPLSNMTVRFLGGLPWLVVALACLLWGEWPWALFIGVAAVIGLLEYYGLSRGQPETGVVVIGVPAAVAVILGFQIDQPALWLGALAAAALAALIVTRGRIAPAANTLIGLIYVVVPLAVTVLLRRELGVFGVLLALCITIGTDTFSYFGGRLFGKTPLAPRISPKKTREGMVVGLIGGALLAAALLAAMDRLSPGTLLIPLVGPPLAVIADLLESALKRHYNVKDSHLPSLNIIPGHGGVLDRADSLLLVAPFVAIVLALLRML